MEPGAITADLLDAAAAQLAGEHDPAYGGFGGAPKFPPHLAMLFLLCHYQRTGDQRSLEIVRLTAEAMARSGIHDQLAGGFAVRSARRDLARQYPAVIQLWRAGFAANRRLLDVQQTNHMFLLTLATGRIAWDLVPAQGTGHRD